MARQKMGLGRGLNSLIGGDEDVRKHHSDDTSNEENPQGEASRNATSFDIDIDLIVPNPDQPRLQFDEAELDELADSIKKNGLLQPILVRRIDDLYQIIAGERRWQACKKNGMKKVPVRVTEADDIQSIALAMIENIQRSDLNPMEEAYGYQMLMERDHMTQAQLAETVSKGRSTIANTLRLLDLPEDAQQLLYEGSISAGHARAILSIPTEEGRQMLTQHLLSKTVSVRDAERLAHLISGKEKQAPKKAPVPQSYKKAAKSLREVLGTNVKVKTVNGKGRIEIEFEDETQLEELFRKLVPGQ